MEDKLSHLPIIDETARWKCTLSVIVFEEIIFVLESKPSFHENENSNTYFQTTNTKAALLFNHLESIKKARTYRSPLETLFVKGCHDFPTNNGESKHELVNTDNIICLDFFFICRSNTQVYWLFSFMYCLVNFVDFWHEKVTYATLIHDNRAFRL